MIDTHVHLDLLTDGGALLQAAVDAGLTHLVSVGVDPRVPATLHDSSPRDLVVVRALGLHPQEVVTEDSLDDALAVLNQQLGHRPADVVAVGECGLDARPGIGNEALHARAFSAQLALARRHDLPVIVHGVRRDGAVIASLDEDVWRHGAPRSARGVWHGFSSSPETMKAAVKRGLFISVGFVVLHKNARRLRAAVPLIPADRLLVETDAPPLPPVRLRDVIESVARLRGVTAREIEELTTSNAQRLFSL